MNSGETSTVQCRRGYHVFVNDSGPTCRRRDSSYRCSEDRQTCNIPTPAQTSPRCTVESVMADFLNRDKPQPPKNPAQPELF